jgi:hypothetical protein
VDGSLLMRVVPLVLLPLTPLLNNSHESKEPLVEVVARRLIVNTEPRTRHQDTAPTVLLPFSID